MTADSQQEYVSLRAELADPHMKLLVDGLAHDYAKTDPPRFAAHLASLRQAQKRLKANPLRACGRRRV